MLQYKKNEEYDVKKVLYDYGQMQYESGLASGRWEKMNILMTKQVIFIYLQ